MMYSVYLNCDDHKHLQISKTGKTEFKTKSGYKETYSRTLLGAIEWKKLEPQRKISVEVFSGQVSILLVSVV